MQWKNCVAHRFAWTGRLLYNIPVVLNGNLYLIAGQDPSGVVADVFQSADGVTWSQGTNPQGLTQPGIGYQTAYGNTILRVSPPPSGGGLYFYVAQTGLWHFLHVFVSAILFFFFQFFSAFRSVHLEENMQFTLFRFLWYGYANVSGVMFRSIWCSRVQVLLLFLSLHSTLLTFSLVAAPHFVPARLPQARNLALAILDASLRALPDLPDPVWTGGYR